MKTASPWHWPEYLIEGASLGLFMISASCFAVLLEHPGFPLREEIPDALARRFLMGLSMGLTAVAIIYSPWGKRSGAHLNPAVTLTFFWLGKVAPRDLLGYVLAQFAGGVLGMIAASALLDMALAHPTVNFVVTLPGAGLELAFAAEFLLTALLMTVVLRVSSHPRLAHFTGLFAGVCVALFITVEAPLSGMSLNPARSLASAVAAREWSALWIYFTAPPLGMLTAAAIHRLSRAREACAKLEHESGVGCIFCDHHTRKHRAHH